MFNITDFIMDTLKGMKGNYPDFQIKEYALDIQNAGQSLLALINDILDFSKVEAEKMEIIPAQYELSSLINDLNNMIKDRAAKKGLKFIVDVNAHIPHLLIGDEIRIRQCVMNILTNAVKYTENGSVNVSTSVYTDIVGTAASNCFGVKGMAARSVTDGVYHLLRKESVGKGVRVHFHEDDSITIDLHIAVDNVNMNAVGASIISEVRHQVTKCTGTKVRAVNVYIDSMMIG